MFRRLAAVTAAVVMSLTLAAEPAQAAWNDCPADNFCTWANTNYWGIREDFSGYNYCLATRWDVSSIRNRHDDVVLLYTNGTCFGTGFAVQVGQSFASMPGQIGDNRLRSIKLLY